MINYEVIKCDRCNEVTECDVSFTCGNYCDNCTCHDCGDVLQCGEGQVCNDCLDEWEEEHV